MKHNLLALIFNNLLKMSTAFLDINHLFWWISIQETWRNICKIRSLLILDLMIKISFDWGFIL